MNKIVTIASSTALVLMTTLASIAPADAQRGPAPGPNFAQRQQFVADWCRRNPRDPDCRDFNRGRWGDAQYNAWFNRHRRDPGFSAPAAIAGMFGAIAGAAIAGAANSNARASNSAACAARYRSYDPRTGTFLGTDGRRHPCTL